MEVLTFSPPASLKRYVDYLWTLQSSAHGLFPLELFANGLSGIIVQSHHGCSALRRTGGTPRTRDNGVPHAFVYGKRTRPGKLVARGPFELAGVVFRPQALHALLRIDPAEVNNGAVDVDDLFVGNVANQLRSAVTVPERLAILGGCLSARIEDGPVADALVSESLRLLRGQVRTIRIRQLLKYLGLSERQFERRFRRAVGISPHQYLRIMRFQEAVRLLRECQFEKMSDLASELNYTDQSHFIKETKEFSGYTPSVLFETVRAAVDLPCALIRASREPRANSCRVSDGFLQSLSMATTNTDTRTCCRAANHRATEPVAREESP